MKEEKNMKNFLRIVLAMLLIAVCITCVPASRAQASTTKTGYVNFDYLRLRSGPSTSYDVVVKLAYKDKVTIKKTLDSGWYKVTAVHNKKTYKGYVYGKYITIKKTTTTKKTSSSSKIVYLTFDDGPGPYTARLLKILDKYDAKATFFVTNQFPKYQKMITKEAKKGHTVAVHTYSHNYAKVYASTKAYFSDFNKMNKIIKKRTGSYAKILRFPGGSSNTVSRHYCRGIMSTLVKKVAAKGYYYADWNVSSEDAGGTTSSTTVANNVIKGIKNHKVSVVLQHDIKSYSVTAVEKILKWGTAHGYQFKAMTTDSYMAHHGVNN